MDSILNKYRFSDFTLSNYRKLLKLALNEYHFIFYNESIFPNERKVLLLRHDVEFSVPIALEMARVEADLGVKSTYFVQLHGDFYNALEKGTFNQLKEIEALGHTLALHFDAHFWGVDNEADLEKFLEIDANTFKTYFGYKPYVFSFHNTTPFILSCDKGKYAGMINVYSKSIKENLGYCADSTGYWRYEVLEDRLREAKDDKLQVLIHDGMWQTEMLPPRRRVYKVIDDHAAFMKKSYDDTLVKFGAKNIDWNGEINGND
jgi:hypothetical protein